MKLKFLIIILLNIYWGISAYGQGWERIYPVDSALLYKQSFVASTIDGGYIIGNPAAPYNMHSYLIKTDVNGQPHWTQEYDFSIYSGAQTTDGGYILAGVIDASTAGVMNEDINVVKTDASGNRLWTKTYDKDDYESINDVQQTTDGGYILGGTNYGGLHLMKMDANGDTTWTKNYGGRDGYAVEQTTDGGYVFTGSFLVSSTKSKIYVVKTDANGDTLWTKTFAGLVGHDYGKDIKQTADGGYVIAAHRNGYQGGLSANEICIYKLDATGSLIWNNHYVGVEGDPESVVVAADGGYLLTGRVHVVGSPFLNDQLQLTKYSAIGLEEWTQNFDDYEYYNGGQAVADNDGYAIVGAPYYDPNGNYINALSLIRTDSIGNTYTNTIKGNIFDDANLNCLKEAGERNFSGILVEAVGNGRLWNGVTDSLGNYCIQVDTGTYVVTVHPLVYWQTCTNAVSVTFNNFFTSDTIDFPFQAQLNCPLMEVNISAPFLRMTGGGSNYTVNYCNKGTVDAVNSYVEVTIDPDLQFISATLPIASQVNNVYQFNLGTVDYNDCGSFQINVQVPVGAVLGQTHCSEAHIYPDSSCLPVWNGAIIKPEVICQNDSILFKLENIGAAMFLTETYYVFEDHVIMLIGNTGNILPSGIMDILVPADTGKTYRVEVAQPTGYPAYLGDSIAKIGIEGCLPFWNGTFNTGFLTQWYTGNSAPNIAVDCQQSIGSYDPNDKAAQPLGYDSQHYIYDHTDLDYRIRFQNTGTDTAFLVVVRDTISDHLDLTTLTMGASSHSYTWRIYGAGILEVTFSNIMLPDSNVNEPASNGFFNYTIEQKVGNSAGTVIYNVANIYFDYNAPIRTNQTWHTINNNFVPVVLSVGEILDEKINVHAYPNPFMESTTIEVDGKEYGELQLSVFDVTGKMVRVEQATYNNKIQLSKGNLQAGIYIYQLVGDGALINTGKVIVQ